MEYNTHLSNQIMYVLPYRRSVNFIVYITLIVAFCYGCENKTVNDIQNQLLVTSEMEQGAFPLISDSKDLTLMVNNEEAEVVKITVDLLASDIEKVGGIRPNVDLGFEDSSDYAIIAGTLGTSRLIDELVQAKGINVDTIKGKWESFIIKTVNHPFDKVKQALVVIGSDKRGTAYGLLEISKLIGVSPWVWWADVNPKQAESLFVRPGTFIQGEPSVKYRGMFLNDEDWGLQPWAAKHLDTDIKDLGPKSYAKIFELMLRLKANIIWPAMHDSTKPFWYYPENPKVADKYGIVISSTHCDMMHRSNTYEWMVNFENEYGHAPDVFQYDVNKNQVYEYWNDRVKDASNYESIFTIGMRGIRDGSIQGPKTTEDKIALMDTIIADQRGMIKKNIGEPAKVPQIFVPYKEVLTLYNRGLEVPEDVTLIWPDDNFGYIRKLSDPEEQKRSGGSGVYYHLSYMGAPHGYLWLSSNSPSLISFEMTKAYQYDASRFWVVNVGDIKPAELETQFFFDLAWDVEKWTPEKANDYVQHWAVQIFGEDLAPSIAEIKKEYYQLLQSGKPEQMGLIAYADEIVQKRLQISKDLINKVNELKPKVPAYLANGFYELIEYPVKSAANMNIKVLNARLSLQYKDQPERALGYSKKSLEAFYNIQNLAKTYTTEIENGKWEGMINPFPRHQEIFGMPEVANMEIVPDSLKNWEYDRRYLDDHLVFKSGTKPGEVSLLANAFNRKKEVDGEHIMIMEGLGLDGNSIARYPFTGASFKENEIDKAPFVEYNVELDKGSYQMSLKCLPTYAIHKGRGLVLGVTVNDEKVKFEDVDHPRKDLKWSTNIMRGYSEAKIPFEVEKSGKSTIKVYLMDTGLVLSRIDINRKNDENE
ncbi:MAG: glycosyl hydrolase 115 family protein [Flavobacteriaceae bacterium]